MESCLYTGQVGHQRLTPVGKAFHYSLFFLYLDLTGQFDRLVSIEMIEAVGHRHLPTYFRSCAERLKPDGAALIQAITMPDHLYDRYLDAPDFINRYIFAPYGNGKMPFTPSWIGSKRWASMNALSGCGSIISATAKAVLQSTLPA